MKSGIRLETVLALSPGASYLGLCAGMKCEPRMGAVETCKHDAADPTAATPTTFGTQGRGGLSPGFSAFTPLGRDEPDNTYLVIDHFDLSANYVTYELSLDIFDAGHPNLRRLLGMDHKARFINAATIESEINKRTKPQD